MELLNAPQQGLASSCDSNTDEELERQPNSLDSLLATHIFPRPNFQAAPGASKCSGKAIVRRTSLAVLSLGICCMLAWSVQDFRHVGVPRSNMQEHTMLQLEAGEHIFSIGQHNATYRTPEEAFKHMSDGRHFIHVVDGPHEHALTYPVFKTMIQQERNKMLLEQGPEAMRLKAAYDRALAQEAAQPDQPNVHALEGWNDFASRGKVSPIKRVQSLYTFGAPGVSNPAVFDASEPSGCFPGLRSYAHAQRYTPGLGIMFRISDPVSWISAGLGFSHPISQVLVLEGFRYKDPPTILACQSEQFDPTMDHFWWVNGHYAYGPFLTGHIGSSYHNTSLAMLKFTWLMWTLSWLSYYPRVHSVHLNVRNFGLELVGHAASEPFDSRGGLKDYAWLYQSPASLDCMLIFEGTDDVGDWLDNFHFRRSDFCGFHGVHIGFRNELTRIVNGIDFQQNIRPLLPKCRQLHVGGHSLGGAQATLFSACANRMIEDGEFGFEQWREFQFGIGERPEKMRPYVDDDSKGVFIKHRGKNLCIDVQGPMETRYKSAVGLASCEYPGTYQDAAWVLSADGLMVHKLSGHCMDVEKHATSSGGAHVILWTCEQTKDSQKWEFTHQAFLRNLHTQKCVNSDLLLYDCPFTDQKWEIRPDGFIVNLLTSMCIDVVGPLSSNAGSTLTQWPCEFNFARTDQRWKITKDGYIQNSLGRCIGIRHQQGREDTPELVLQDCIFGVSNTELQWDLAPGGFIKHRESGKCIDVEGRPGLDAGRKLNLQVCEDTTPTQTTGMWTMTPEGFVVNTGSWFQHWGSCIKPPGMPGTKIGSKLTLYYCATHTDQTWQFTPGGFIKNTLGAKKCIDVVGDLGSKPGDVLDLYNCEDPEEEGSFRELKWDVLPEGFIMNRHHMRCIDVVGSPGIKDGDSLTLWKCENTITPTESTPASDQRWSIRADGFIMNALSGKCMDIRGTLMTEVGSPLVLYTCEKNSTQTDQRWKHTPDGFIRHQLSGHCLGFDGKRLRLQACPRTDQRWEYQSDGKIRNLLSGLCMASTTLMEMEYYPYWRLGLSDCNDVATTGFDLVPSTGPK